MEMKDGRKTGRKEGRQEDGKEIWKEGRKEGRKMKKFTKRVWGKKVFLMMNTIVYVCVIQIWSQI